MKMTILLAIIGIWASISCLAQQSSGNSATGAGTGTSFTTGNNSRSTQQNTANQQGTSNQGTSNQQGGVTAGQTAPTSGGPAPNRPGSTDASRNGLIPAAPGIPSGMRTPQSVTTPAPTASPMPLGTPSATPSTLP